MTIQERKLDQSHKTPNVPLFTPIRTDRTHKYGGLLTYVKNNISFSQLNTSNIFPIEQQIIKIHLLTSQQLHITNTYILPSCHKQNKTQLYSKHLQPLQIFQTQSSQQTSMLTHRYDICQPKTTEEN